MRYAIISVALFMIDGIIKYRVEKYGKAGEILPVLQGKLLLRKYHNTGAMLGIGKDKPYVIACISVLFSVFMTGVFVATLGYHGKTALKTGLALLLGGAYSNTYDRVKRKYVVDYVSFPVKNEKLRNIIFNISDFGIIIGAFLLCLQGVIVHR